VHIKRVFWTSHTFSYCGNTPENLWEVIAIIYNLHKDTLNDAKYTVKKNWIIM